MMRTFLLKEVIEVLEKEFPGKGQEYAEQLRDKTIALYKKCADYALEHGIIIADTKFEFGLDENGNIVIGDEMLTPDRLSFLASRRIRTRSWTAILRQTVRPRLVKEQRT